MTIRHVRAGVLDVAYLQHGDPAGVPPAPAVDIDGALRPYGPRVDVGAYEWQGQGALLPIIIKE